MSGIEPICGICNKRTTAFGRNKEYYHAWKSCKNQFTKLDQTQFKECSCCKDVQPVNQMEKSKTCLSCRNPYKNIIKKIQNVRIQEQKQYIIKKEKRPRRKGRRTKRLTNSLKNSVMYVIVQL